MVETHRTKARKRRESGTPAAIECGVRQLLADKVSGTMVGCWLLIAEFLRLGVWDFLCGWTKQRSEHLAPRLALQMVNEAALCVAGVREQRCLSQKGFELANGLPFVATDTDIHLLLNQRSIDDTQRLQVAFGKMRRASGHFPGRLLAIDPHRLPSHSKRQMVRRREKPEAPANKQSQTFFCLDTESCQPVCFTVASSARNVTQATPELLKLAADILQPGEPQPLVMADSEHFTAELINQIHQQNMFELLVPMPRQRYYQKTIDQLSQDSFHHQWAGLATAKTPFHFNGQCEPAGWQFIQRTGENADTYRFKSFLSTADRDEVDALTRDYPKRWHVEEFFNLYQNLGWKKAGTMNLNIRYGRMTMALIAQAAIHQLRQRLPDSCNRWEASHLARNLLQGLDGDIRVHNGDTILVTFYNAPDAEHLSPQYTDLPKKLESENIDPRIPWLYGFKLDFRFK